MILKASRINDIPARRNNVEDVTTRLKDTNSYLFLVYGGYIPTNTSRSKTNSRYFDIVTCTVGDDRDITRWAVAAGEGVYGILPHGVASLSALAACDDGFIIPAPDLIICTSRRVVLTHVRLTIVSNTAGLVLA